MNKKLMLVVMALLTMSFVSAWHCVDYNEDGNAVGWLEVGPVPDGCVATDSWWNPYVCTDGQVDDCTYREFSCIDREGHQGETVISYEDSNTCQDVPEFGTLGAGIALLGAGGFMLRKRK